MSKMSAFRMLIGNSSNKCIQENVDYVAPDFSNGAPARPPLCPIQESGQKQLADLSGFEHSTPRGKTDASLTPKEKKSSMLTQAGVAFCMYAENDDGNGNGATPEKQVTHANRKFSWYQKHQKQHSSLAEDALHTGRKSPSSFKQENGSSEAQGTPSRPPSNLTGHHSLQTLATNKHGGAIQYSTPRASRIEVKPVQSTYELGNNSQTLNVTPRKSVSRTLKYGQSGCVNGLSNEGSASVVSKQLGARNTVIRSLGFSQPKVFPQQLIPYCSVPHYELEEDLSFWQEHNVQVLIRTRPLNSTEIAVQGYNRCIKQDSAHSLTWTAQPEARFTFDHVACETITQAKLFNVAGLPMVENCMSGYNSCMFAYGQTGSGKTHTMLGDIGDLDQQPSESRGMTPRVFEYLFVRIQKEEESRRHERLKYICKCSFLEIYNEQITDLLEPSSTNLQLREDAKKGVYVENLTEIEVTSVQDVMKLLLQGSCNRKVAATNMNRESSRSHSVFTCIIESKWEHDSVINTRFGRLNLVDLAGSERQKTSGAEGDRLKEAANINKSLSTLGLVIMVLVDIANGKQRHVPYRDSKLTFLLQDSLGGNSKTTIIATVSPSYCCSMETLSTLKFAQRAKFIRNNAVVNEDTSGDVVALRQQIQQLKEEVYCLRRQALGQFSSVGQLNKLVDASYATLDPEMADCSVGNTEILIKKMKRLDALLSGSLRREQSAEKTSKMLAEEIEQLNILVRQREDDTQCGKMMLRFREDKIRRLESLSHGLISADTFLADENRALSEELQLLRNSIDRNPQLTRFAMENIRLMEQLRKFQDFYDRGERETMLEEISNLRDQLSELLDQKLMNTEQKQDLPPEFDEAVQENKSLRNEVCKYQSEIEELKASLKKFQEENNQYSRQAGDLELKLSTLRTEYEEQQNLLQVLNREVISENKHGLEDQNQLLMSELETLLEQHQKIRDSLTEVEHRERYFKKKLRLLQKERAKERELRNLEEEVANRSEDDNNVMLEEKLERTRTELEEAQKRNIIFQGEEACRMATEQEMDLMRTEVEAETADVIASMHSELQAMRAQLAVALEHETLTQERVAAIMSELDQTKQNLDALSKENARLVEKHEIMLHGKDSEIQELRKNWEEATVKLIDYLAEGDQALNAAAKEMEDIIEESFPNCVAHLPENNLRHAVSRIAQKQKVIEILQKKLQQAFEIAKDAEYKIKSLNEEMDQQEMLSSHVRKMELLLAEKESEVLFCLSEKRAFETAISQYCDEIQHLKEKIQNKETELEVAHKELENSIHTQMAESEAISQRDVKTMELLLATKENEVLSCLSEKSALETAMNHYCGEIQHLKEKLENKETELEVAHKELKNSIHAQTVQKSECISQNDAKKMELLLAEKESALVSCLSERQALETAIRQHSDEIQHLKENIQNKETELEAAHKELGNHLQTQMDKESKSISQIDVCEMQLEDLRNSLNLARLDVVEKRSEAAALLGKLEESQAMFKEAQMLVDALVRANESAKRDAEWWKAELQKLILLQVNSLPEWDSLRTELDELKLSFSAQHDPSEMGEESISKKTDLPENLDVISKYADMISGIADEDTDPSKPLFLMENVITKFSTHMNALVVENTKLKEQLQEMLLTNKALMNNLDQNHNMERELDSKLLELKKLQARSADLKERAGELECRNILLEKELDVKSGMIGSLQSDIAEKTAQVERLQLVAKRVDQELLDSSKACQSMEAQLSEVKKIREDRDSTMAENANLRDQIEVLSERCSCLEADLAERSHAIHILQAELDVKIGEIQTMQSTINQVESREDRDSTMAENTNMRDQMEVLSKRCNCLELDLAEKSHAMRVLQAELDAKTHEVQNMQTTINQVEADLTESSNALQILKDQLLDLQGNTNTVAEENFELKKQVDELQSRNSYLEEELDDKQYVIDSLEAELLELNPMLEQKIADSLKAINQELNAVERERDQLHAELVVANEQLEMVQGMVDEREAVAAEARHAAELSKTHAEEKEEETKLLERSVEELESTVNALENQVGIVKRETEMQRLLREDLEMEVQELKHQLSMAHAHTESIKQLESSLNDLGEKQERDSGNEIELLQLLDEVEKLHKEISNKDAQIKACKSHISELVAASGRQVSEHQKKIKELESMMEQLKPRVSTPSQKSEKSGGKLKGSGSPFSCMRLGMSQQVGSEIEEELLANKRRIEELEAIASARQKEVFMLNARLAEAESMTHDVVRDLLGVKTDITNYVALLGEKHHDSKEDEDLKNKAEVQKLRKQLNDFIAERESWLEEINKRQADMIAARMAAEKVRVRDQLLTEENEKLKVECAAQKKYVHDLEAEVKKLSGQQNLQQRIHHHAKIKDENNTLKVKNEDLSARLRRTELLLGRVNDELARYRTAEGKTPYINIDEEQQLKGKLQEAENGRLQMAQKLIKLCTSIMQAAGINKFEAETDPSAAFDALKELEMRLVSTKQELEDLKFKSRLAGEKRRLSELKTSQSPMRSINFAAA